MQIVHLLFFLTPRLEPLTGLFWSSLRRIQQDEEHFRYILHIGELKEDEIDDNNLKADSKNLNISTKYTFDNLYKYVIEKRALWLRNEVMKIPNDAYCLSLDIDIFFLRPLSHLIDPVDPYLRSNSSFVFMRNGFPPRDPDQHEGNPVNGGMYLFRASPTAKQYFVELEKGVRLSTRKSDQIVHNILVHRGLINASIFNPHIAAFNTRTVCNETVLFHAIGIRNIEGKLSKMQEAKKMRHKACAKDFTGQSILP